MSDTDYEQRLKTGRNESCPCGSGKKYKKCHLAEDQAQRSAALKALEDEAKAKAAAEAEDEEAEAEKAGTAKDKARKPKRGQGKTKGKAPDAKPKNIPRRGAV